MSKNNAVTKVAIFDFCGTFVPFQTADAYIKWLNKDYISYKKKKRVERLQHFYSKTRLNHVYAKLFNKQINKITIAKTIKGIDYNTAKKYAETFVEKCIKPQIIKQTESYLSEFKKRKEKGENIFIMFVSAAYDIYLDIFKNQYGFDGIVSTGLEHKNNKMTGKILHDCVGYNKKKMAIKYLDKTFGAGNYNIIFSIGDSISDIPILDVADKKVVIAQKHNDWIKDDYEEVII